MDGLYGTSHVSSIEEAANDERLLELFLIDDLLRESEDVVKEFCESAEAQILVEKQVLNKPTLHRLSKQDDLKRRTKLVCYQLAKDAKDPEWAKLVKYQTLKKQSAKKILTKYENKAKRIAAIAQKQYIAKARKLKATAEEQKAQSAK